MILEEFSSLNDSLILCLLVDFLGSVLLFPETLQSAKLGFSSSQEKPSLCFSHVVLTQGMP